MHVNLSMFGNLGKGTGWDWLRGGLEEGGLYRSSSFLLAASTQPVFFTWSQNISCQVGGGLMLEGTFGSNTLLKVSEQTEAHVAAGLPVSDSCQQTVFPASEGSLPHFDA